ncbi:MAG: TipAS antibiotic-recognition domain-containing protein [Eubacterium sp.]|nr:TipAS antibiotic-recognition domain-containing protein [Eubacterium sp.]
MVIDYEKQAAERWGATDAYKEYKEKRKERGTADNEKLQQDMMNIFAEFTKLDCAPADESAQELVAKLQSYITENFYTCTNEILAGLGKMYVTDSEFKNNIDGYAGEGIAEFVSKAIEVYTRKFN